uniref:Uncharacterized protein n=1 Tax=Ovis aries TaxID=9940 RepID=A0AC11DT42_SHEEP
PHSSRLLGAGAGQRGTPARAPGPPSPRLGLRRRPAARPSTARRARLLFRRRRDSGSLRRRCRGGWWLSGTGYSFSYRRISSYFMMAFAPPKNTNGPKMQTKMSTWTPLNHQLLNDWAFEERRALLGKWVAV